jgi:enhancer of polycomb-like protein
MDERDQEWLEKNNEEARGEGTSTQGAVSSTPRLRASKKGKEPDVSPSVSMTEDEFELIMGVFERITHDKTEHLHLVHSFALHTFILPVLTVMQSLETGMDFPAFVPDYEDAFSHDLPISLFAAFSVPSWVPPPASLLKLARAVYPHWKERRLERGGHRISPALNVSPLS